MWRAIFLALGITLIVVGGQFFMVDQMEIKRVRRPRIVTTPPGQVENSPFQQASFKGKSSPAASPTVIFRPKDWMPWSLLAVGSIVLIYTFTIPRRSYSE